MSHDSSCHPALPLPRSTPGVTQDSRSPPLALCSFSNWAGREGRKRNCRALLSSAGWTFSAHVKCCRKEHWQGRVVQGEKKLLKEYFKHFI